MALSTAQWTRFRITLVFVLFVLACGIILWRAFELQVLESDELSELAEREGYKVIKLNPVRGEILDSTGERLAVSLPTDSVFAQPNRIADSKKAAASLAEALGMNKAQLAKRMEGDRNFVFIKRQVTPEEAERVRALDMEGIGLIKESRRYYPNGALASHVLGFVGVDARGLEGVELGCDQFLQGGVNHWRVMRDARGRTFLNRDTEGPTKDRGATVHLTLDRRIQYVVEAALARAVEEHKAQGGMALVVRPRTGEILAAAVYPGFNPNVFGRYSEVQRRNKIFTDTFDPGSTFKVFVVAGALEEALVTPEKEIFCENGAYAIGRHLIHDHHKYGWLTVSKVIKHSSNIGTAKIGDMMGPALMYEYLSRFNFGHQTEVDFPGESGGVLRPYRKWRKLDAANVAFGQGVSVTALQMTMAMSALANDGVLMRPYIVSRITDEHGLVVKKAHPQIVRQVVSVETAREVQAMLREVVTAGGTGWQADSEAYPGAGKTGTAQKLDLVTKRYSDEKYFSSFLGYVPYKNPELTIFVALDEPSKGTYGGVVAAPVFKEIAEQVLPMLNVSPANGQPVLSPEIQEVKAPLEAPAGTVRQEVSQGTNSLTVRINPEMEMAVAAVAAEIRADEEAMADGPMTSGPEETVVVPGTEGQVMPNLAGLSMRRVVDLMSRYEVALSFTGSGQVVWQAPPPGQVLSAGQVCQIKFEQW